MTPVWRQVVISYCKILSGTLSRIQLYINNTVRIFLLKSFFFVVEKRVKSEVKYNSYHGRVLRRFKWKIRYSVLFSRGAKLVIFLEAADAWTQLSIWREMLDFTWHVTISLLCQLRKNVYLMCANISFLNISYLL